MSRGSQNICVIGSGLAASVLCDTLAGHHRVTVFERGNAEAERPVKAEMPGCDLGLYPSYAYGLGGTTNFWHGGLVPFSDNEFTSDWSDQVVEELSLHYGDVVSRLYGSRAFQAWRSASASGLTGDCHPSQLFYPPSPFRAAESGLLNMANVRLGAKVTHIDEQASGVMVTSDENGRIRREHFDRVVLAAGAMNSPVILQNSGLGGDNVGYNLTDHPMGFVAKLKVHEQSPAFAGLRNKNATFGDTEPMLKVRDRETGLWSAFYLRAGVGSGLSSDPYRRSFGFLSETSRLGKYRAAAGHLHDPDFLWQAVENHLGKRLPSNHAYVLVLNEQEATGQGHVSEQRDGRLCVDWRISTDVEAAIRRNLECLAEYAGAELIVHPGDLRNRLWSGAHHAGTCRISRTIEHGVVDSDLRVFGTDNIYVCDASVLPSTGASNTGLTIASLARRLGSAWVCERRSAAVKHYAHEAQLVISGATGAIGQMMRAQLAEHDVAWSSVDVRRTSSSKEPMPQKSVLLHLANAHDDVQTNLVLQEQTAAYMDRAGIEQIIVPMSASTILELSGKDPDADRPNYGFEYVGNDPYPLGKLASERFWMTWQASRPGRHVRFVYIPTIVGPRSEWTRNIANHAPGCAILVPELDDFHVVTEADLVEKLLNLSRNGLPQGLTRSFALSSSKSLYETIAGDRKGPASAIALPGIVWRLIALSNSSGVVGKGISAGRVLIDKSLRALASRALVPIAPRYLHLFKQQGNLASQFAQIADNQPAMSGPEMLKAGNLPLVSAVGE